MVIIAGVVGVGLLIESFQDWRMLRALRRRIAQTRAERQRGRRRGPMGK